jgi:hypothetical protein
VGEIIELCNGAYPAARPDASSRRHSFTVQQHRATITQPAHILVAASATVLFLTLDVFATAPPLQRSLDFPRTTTEQVSIDVASC